MPSASAGDETRATVSMLGDALHLHWIESLQAAPLLARRRSASRVRMWCVRVRRASMGCGTGVSRIQRERVGAKLHERLLTPEKSVIRFRPADISCGSKLASATQEPAARRPTPPAVPEGGCRRPVPHAKAGFRVPAVSISKPAACRVAGFLVERKRHLPMRRPAPASEQHPFRRAWRAGGRSQVRYLRCLSQLGFTDLPIDEEPSHGC